MGQRVGGRHQGWWAGIRQWAASGLGLLLLLVVLTGPGPDPAAALSLPGRRAPAPMKAGNPGVGGAGLQEVAPPAAVQQLQEALEGRRARVKILMPADGALLPEGPWQLKLQVEDWPLVDAGPLGLGPHLVAQLDADPPLAFTSTEITMRPLQPGSHRLVVYAARPWGEGVKIPGAATQIRLHRAAANPLALAAPSSPQLIAVSPMGEAAAPPLLLDWLLINAPLQNLRQGDTSWRLRVSVNGESFLVDQQTPLWLKGWRPGSNAIQLELLDGTGEPLNPPFNSLVSEVTLRPGSAAPRWQGGQLDAVELAQLLGEAPPPEPEPEPQTEPQTEPETETETETAEPPTPPTITPTTSARPDATEPDAVTTIATGTGSEAATETGAGAEADVATADEPLTEATELPEEAVPAPPPEPPPLDEGLSSAEAEASAMDSGAPGEAPSDAAAPPPARATDESAPGLTGGDPGMAGTFSRLRRRFAS